MSQNQCAHGTRQWHCARLPNSPYIRISGGLFARPSLSPSCANAVGEYKQGLPHPFPPSLFGLGPAISGSGGLRVQARSASFYPTRRLSPPGQRFQLRSPPLHLLPLPSSNPPSPALISCSKGSLCGLSSCDFRRRTVVLPQICFPAAKKHKSLNEAVLAMAEILDFSPVPTLVVSPSLHVRTASDGLLKAWGRGRDALVGKNLFAVLYSDPTTDRFDCIPLRHAIESAVSTRTLRVCHAAYFRTRFLGLHALHQCTELTDCCA